MKQYNWKRIFLILLGINVLVIIVFVVGWFSLFSGPTEEKRLVENSIDPNDVYFQITTNKNDLNRIINHYLEEEFPGALDYEVFLADEVELYGNIPVFTSMVEMKLTFEPQALDNGDLELHQKNISIGKLSLPVTHVLKLIRDSYSLPEWVTIYPNEEKVYVSLKDLKLKSNLKVRAEEFNLKKDNIRFSLLLPLEEQK